MQKSTFNFIYVVWLVRVSSPTHCLRMESVSIFSLNDDCLCNVLSFLNIFSSFYSFSLTCKRFNHLANYERNWHINIFKRKAEFYMRQFIVYSVDPFFITLNDRRGLKSRERLLTLVEEAVQYSIDHLSYKSVSDVWKWCGPVAAKYFSWIISSRSETLEEGETCEEQCVEQTFHLPSCDKDLSIFTSHFVDYMGEICRETIIKVSCGDLEIRIKVYGIVPEDYDSWSEEEMRAVVDPLKPVIELLQKELGDTVPPITDQFFVWMCFRFPRLREEHRIYFKDEDKNAVPTMESLQTVLDLYCQNNSLKIKKSLKKWLKRKKKTYAPYSAEIMARPLEILVKKSQTGILRQLCEDARRFCIVMTDMYLKKAPKKMMVDLVNRTTLFSVNYTPAAIAAKYVVNKAQFRMKGGSILKIEGEIRGDWTCFTACEVILNFSLPDGSKIEIQSLDFVYPHPNTNDFEPLINKLSPITEILQECINESMKMAKNIPRIENLFTLYYFLSVIQFWGVTRVFEDDGQFLFKCNESECYESTSDSD